MGHGPRRFAISRRSSVWTSTCASRRPASVPCSRSWRRRCCPTARRVSCSNALVCAVMLLMEPGQQNVQRCIFSSSTVWESWHGEQSRRLRSAGEGLTWLFEQVVEGQFLRTCLKTFQQLVDRDRLSFCGLSVGLPEVEGLPEEHPLVVEQDELAGHCGNLALHSVGSLVRRCMWMLRGWLGNTVRFTGNARQVALGAKLLTKDFENFERLSQEPSKEARKLISRSVFRTVPIQQAVACLQSTGWEVSAEIKELYTLKHQRLLAIQLIEEWFQRLRRTEDHTFNKHGRPATAMMSLVQKKVIQEVHHFTPPPTHGSVFDRNSKFP